LKKEMQNGEFECWLAELSLEERRRYLGNMFSDTSSHAARCLLKAKFLEANGQQDYSVN
jgi:hypothetical protein